MKKGIIFDLDGVVVDTVPIHFKAWKKMFNEYGKEFTFEDYKEKVDGIPRIDGARSVLNELSPEELEKAADLKQSYFRDTLDSDEIPVYQSTIDLILALKAQGVPRAVISSSKNCTYILKKIGIYDSLTAVIDGNKITKGKPDPQIFLLAAEAIKCNPAACIVFEDAVLGVEAAKNAGMYCIGIDRYGNPDRLSRADRIITDISDISAEEVLSL